MPLVFSARVFFANAAITKDLPTKNKETSEHEDVLMILSQILVANSAGVRGHT